LLQQKRILPKDRNRPHQFLLRRTVPLPHIPGRSQALLTAWASLPRAVGKEDATAALIQSICKKVLTV